MILSFHATHVMLFEESSQSPAQDAFDTSTDLYFKINLANVPYSCLLREFITYSHYLETYSTTSKVFAQFFTTKIPSLLVNLLIDHHNFKKHVAFSSDYIVYISEFSNRSLYLILNYIIL